MSEFKKTSHAIVLFEGKVLLELRDNKPNIPDPDRWTFPGGGIELGENHLDAVKRELKEEINLTPQDIAPLGLIINAVTRSRHQMYVCRLTAEEASGVKLGNEGQEVRFFTYEEIIGVPCAKYVQSFITQSRDGFKKLLETGEIDKKLLGFDEEDVLYI
jgi:8-oxo-dGTP diphosphatase